MPPDYRPLFARFSIPMELVTEVPERDVARDADGAKGDKGRRGVLIPDGPL